MAAPTRSRRISSTPLRSRRKKKDRTPAPPPKPAAVRGTPPHEPAEPPPVIEFRGVAKEYDSGDYGVEQATFSIARRDFVFLVGPSGSGKSTLIRLLIKEIEPTAGKLRVAGRDLTEIPDKGIPYYRRNLGVVYQDFRLLPTRTVYDNVAYALQVTGHSRKEIRAKVPDILRLTGLATKLHNFPDQLSGGEQQRVSIARAFVNHPPLLVADEPTGNLDPETSIGIMQLLYRINRTGTTVLVATHDKEMVDKMRRRVIQLEQGRVIRDEAAGLYTGDESTREFAARMRDGDPGPGAELPVSRAGKRAAVREARREVDALPRELHEDD
jgi:cell division transport system ATP-binding protein